MIVQITRPESRTAGCEGRRETTRSDPRQWPGCDPADVRGSGRPASIRTAIRPDFRVPIGDTGRGSPAQLGDVATSRLCCRVSRLSRRSRAGISGHERCCPQQLSPVWRKQHRCDSGRRQPAGAGSGFADGSVCERPHGARPGSYPTGVLSRPASLPSRPSADTGVPREPDPESVPVSLEAADSQSVSNLAEPGEARGDQIEVGRPSAGHPCERTGDARR